MTSYILQAVMACRTWRVNQAQLAPRPRSRGSVRRVKLASLIPAANYVLTKVIRKKGLEFFVEEIVMPYPFAYLKHMRQI